MDGPQNTLIDHGPRICPVHGGCKPDILDYFTCTSLDYKEYKLRIYKNCLKGSIPLSAIIYYQGKGEFRFNGIDYLYMSDK